MPSKRWIRKDKYPDRLPGGPSVCDPIDPNTEVGQQRIAFKEHLVKSWSKGGGIHIGDPMLPRCEKCNEPVTYTSKRTGKHWCDAHKPVPRQCDKCGEPAYYNSYHSRDGHVHLCKDHYTAGPRPLCEYLGCTKPAKYEHTTDGTKFCAGCWNAIVHTRKASTATGAPVEA